VEIAKLGHVALVTPDLEGSLGFWRDVIGLEVVDREGDTAYLRSWGDFDHHSLSLTAGDEARVDHVAWRTKRPEHLEEFATTVHGARWVEAGAERGQGRALRFESPDGHAFELYYEMEKAPRSKRLKSNASPAWAHGVSPRRIDHVNLVSSDPGRTCGWLDETLGFQMRELISMNDGSMLGGWMGVTNLLHDIAVMRDSRPAGFHHLAFYLDNAQDVLRAADIVTEHAIPIDGGPGRHGISQAIFLYVKDPASGHRLELFSGGYLVFDPDWEPVVWHEDELGLGLGMTWWGPDLAGAEEMATTTSF
jgi:catechol 2,3 dioxygenase